MDIQEYSSSQKLEVSRNSKLYFPAGTFNNITSECTIVESGIGQGTIVGPLIFLLYINDLVRSLPDVHVNMYADDCILYTTGNTWNQLHARLQLV